MTVSETMELWCSLIKDAGVDESAPFIENIHINSDSMIDNVTIKVDQQG
jgi:hypothetical protein